LLPIEEAILRRSAAALTESSELLATIAAELTICLIGQRRFREAMDNISTSRPNPDDLDIRDAFNYAMAEWADTKSPPLDLLRRVLDLDKKGEPFAANNPNYSQCLAIVNWRLGDLEEARHRVARARQQIDNRPAPAFSPWRYLYVSPWEFLRDLDLLSKAIDSKEGVLEFMHPEQNDHAEHLA
jgi:hypothetical protein